MLNLPHHYSIKVNGAPTGDLIASADHLPYLEVCPPLEFGGPGDKWSPEDLLMAAVENRGQMKVSQGLLQKKPTALG